MTGDTPLELCIVTASLTEVLVRPILSHPSDGGSSRSTIKEVRTSASDFLRRMSTYFPFDSRISAFTSSSNTGLPPNFELSLSYANLAILLSPAPIPLVLTHGQKRERGWKERVKAVEGAWKAMRGHARGGDQGKGKKVDGWAVEEVAEWMVGILVGHTITITRTHYYSELINSRLRKTPLPLHLLLSPTLHCYP